MAQKHNLTQEEIIIIAIVVLLLVGFVLIFTGMKTSIFGGKAGETQDIKENILESLDLVEKNLEDVDKILNTPSS